MEKIEVILSEYGNHILFLLDGFDDVQSSYRSFGEAAGGVGAGADDKKVRTVVDFAMSFPNGIIISRSDAVPKSWIANHIFGHRFEMLGLSEDNVKEYVQSFFNQNLSSPSHATSRSLLQALQDNPELMSLAQIPINIASLCLSWAEDTTTRNRVVVSTTGLCYNVVLLLTCRYCGIHHISQEDISNGTTVEMLTDEEVMERCREEIDLIGDLAFEAFKNNEIQTLSGALMQRIFQSREQLQSVVSHMGVLIESRHPDHSEGSYAPHHFIHRRYHEFFVALHIARVSIMRQSDDLTIEQWRQQRLQDCSRILMDPHPKNSGIRLLLSGLTTMVSKYSKGSNYFWDACVEIPVSISSPFLGMHPHTTILRAHNQILRETMLTHGARTTTATAASAEAASPLPQRLRIFERKIHHIYQVFIYNKPYHVLCNYCF